VCSSHTWQQSSRLDEVNLSNFIKTSSSHTNLLASQAEDGSWLDRLDRLGSWGTGGFEPAGAQIKPNCFLFAIFSSVLLG
jgi:hypothetical protein